MNQQYLCCGEQFPTVLEAVIHLWTRHLGHDVGLRPEESIRILRDMEPLGKQKEWTFWCDMTVELQDMKFR